MLSRCLYTGLVAVMALVWLAELRRSRRNTRWSLARGGIEAGRLQHRLMVLLHLGLLASGPLEVWLAPRFFEPLLGAPMLALAVFAQVLRWWSIDSLGPRWSTRVIVLPGRGRVRTGPYRLLRHPSHVAAVLEGAALPLVHSAWLTALLFTALNAMLLAARVRCEEAALDLAEQTRSAQIGPGGATLRSLSLARAARQTPNPPHAGR